MELIVFALPAALIAFGYLIPGLARRRDEDEGASAGIGVGRDTTLCQSC